MNFTVSPELILGSFLIVWGAAIIIKMIWGIDIPIFRPLIAFFLIYLGLSFLFGKEYICTYSKTYHYSRSIDERDDQ